jgi:hypothetical protein
MIVDTSRRGSTGFFYACALTGEGEHADPCDARGGLVHRRLDDEGFTAS